jgi:hypothetical protein
LLPRRLSERVRNEKPSIPTVADIDDGEVI